MKKKVLNFLWLIPFILGIIIGVIGIGKLRKAQDMYVPEMGESGWYEASEKQSKATMGAVMMMAGGFGFLTIFGSIATFGVVKTVNSKQFQSMRQLEASLDNLDEDNNKESNILDKLSNLAKQKDEPLFCEYCGAMLKKDSNTCDACGARYKK